MKQIQLTQGYEAIIDDKDFALVSKYNWYYNDGYAKAYHKGKRLRMHRLILNAKNGQQVDHQNRNRLDNRHSNLRICTLQENNRNISMRKDNTSGYKGVSLDKSTGHWKPLIHVDGKAKTCGQFKNKHHAALAYDLWAVDLHGEYASTNFTVVGSGLKFSSAFPVNLGH
jgi:hypothetical protein